MHVACWSLIWDPPGVSYFSSPKMLIVSRTTLQHSQIDAVVQAWFTLMCVPLKTKYLYRQSQYPKLWFEKCLIPIAPRLEQLACNREVMSSILTRGEVLSVNDNSDCFKNGDAVEKSDTTRTCLAFRVLASAIKISMCVQTAISGQSSRFYDIIICSDELRNAAAEAKFTTKYLHRTVLYLSCQQPTKLITKWSRE